MIDQGHVKAPSLTPQPTNLSPRAFLILLVIASYLPFLNQAFHIDDRIYLEVADHILKEPLFPYGYSPVFEGLISPDAASHSHLPLISYYLAAVKLLTGSEQEWVYHLAFLGFPLLATLGFYELAQRYVRFPGAAASLLVIAPGFYVLSHTLMTEVPLLAFWILSLSRFLRVVSGEGSRADWWICAVSLLAASFISLVSGILILLMTVYWFFTRGSKGRGGSSSTVPLLLLLPVLLWLVWYLFSYFHYDRLVLANTARHIIKRGGFSWNVVVENGLSFILHLGGVMLFPLALWIALAGKIIARVVGLIFLLCFVPFYVWFSDWSDKQIFLFALFFSSGLLVVWEVGSTLTALWRSRVGWPGTPSDSQCYGRVLLLCLWFLAILAVCLFLYYSGSVRYSLLVSPPVILLWMIALERRVTDSYFLRNLVWLAVVVTGGYSVVISSADYQFAQVYRTVAREIFQDYTSDGTVKGAPGTPSRRVWFTAEWGFRYYLEKAGARILPRTKAGPSAGDIIVKPYLASPWSTLYDPSEYTYLLEQRYAQLKSPLRILDFTSRAGFYSTGWGILPVSLTEGEPWEWFNVFQVRKAYEGPIPAEERHW